MFAALVVWVAFALFIGYGCTGFFVVIIIIIVTIYLLRFRSALTSIGTDFLGAMDAVTPIQIGSVTTKCTIIARM